MRVWSGQQEWLRDSGTHSLAQYCLMSFGSFAALCHYRALAPASRRVWCPCETLAGPVSVLVSGILGMKQLLALLQSNFLPLEPRTELQHVHSSLHTQPQLFLVWKACWIVLKYHSRKESYFLYSIIYVSPTCELFARSTCAGVNALALHGICFCVFVAALLRSTTSQCWKTPVAKEEERGEESWGEVGGKCSTWSRNTICFCFTSLQIDKGEPLGCARTCPPVGGNNVELELSKNSCLETDPCYLLVLVGEMLKVWALNVLFFGPQTGLQVFSPQRCLKLSLTRLKWCASSPSCPQGFDFKDYSEICKWERCWNQLPWASVEKHLMVCGILQINSQAPSPVGGTFPSLMLSVARALCLAYSHTL